MANWGTITSRGDVEDRRSQAPLAVGGMSLGGVALLLAINFLMGGDLGDVLNQIPNVPTQQQPAAYQQEEADPQYREFASTVLGSNNEYWSQQFTSLNKTYSPPRLILFRQATASDCGTATSDVGPHYCPLDQYIYLDETFFDALSTRLGAKDGDVAQAYVIAHEVGHHVQNELGVMEETYRMVRGNPDAQNEISVRTELQADCFAGLWAGSIRGILEPGEISEAMDAASAVGDDRIQSRVTGYINPESWTHGSSKDRVDWFTKGYNSDNIQSCNTFQ
jgi:uncharacterized protein